MKTMNFQILVNWAIMLSIIQIIGGGKLIWVLVQQPIALMDKEKEVGIYLII